MRNFYLFFLILGVFSDIDYKIRIKGVDINLGKLPRKLPKFPKNFKRE